jgi:hypothetical protein
MTVGSRLTALLALAALVAVAGACDLLPPDPSPPPSSAPSAAAGPTTADISAALDALDTLQSYRFAQSVADPQAGGLAQARGIVINEPERRLHVDYSAGGAFAGGQVTIGDQTWLSVSGDAWQLQDDAGSIPGEDWINPVANAFDPWALGLDDVRDLGIEDHDGIPSRHLHATAAVDDSVDEDGFPTGSGFTGEADVWIARDGGWLVAARAVGTQAWPSTGEADPSPLPSPMPYRIDIAVDGVNDPGNVVDEPGSAAATSVPTGDPEAAALVKGIAGGLRTLDAYAFTITSSTGGMELTETLTVVNRPDRVAVLEQDAIAGLDASAVLVTADGAWSRSGDGPWRRSRPNDPARCGTGGDPAAELVDCTFSRLTDVAASIRAARDTFTIVATGETIGDTAVTHLRSEAGIRQAGLEIPGTRDVWIANDGGYLVRDVFTGFGLRSQAVIGRVNDPTIAIEIPAR